MKIAIILSFFLLSGLLTMAAPDSAKGHVAKKHYKHHPLHHHPGKHGHHYKHYKH